jgi:hypothetical protein
MTSEQRDRYEYFRRSNFPKRLMVKLVQQASGKTLSNDTLIKLFNVCAKSLVGSVVERSRQVMSEAEQVRHCLVSCVSKCERPRRFRLNAMRL